MKLKKTESEVSKLVIGVQSACNIQDILRI